MLDLSQRFSSLVLLASVVGLLVSATLSKAQVDNPDLFVLSRERLASRENSAPNPFMVPSSRLYKREQWLSKGDGGKDSNIDPYYILRSPYYSAESQQDLNTYEEGDYPFPERRFKRKQTAGDLVAALRKQAANRQKNIRINSKSFRYGISKR